MTSEYNISQGKQGSLGSASMSKTQVNIHLDDDILEWFGIKENKADINIQTSINHILREHRSRCNASLSICPTFCASRLSAIDSVRA